VFFVFFVEANSKLLARLKHRKEPKRGQNFSCPQGFGNFLFFLADLLPFQLANTSVFAASEKPILSPKIFKKLLGIFIHRFLKRLSTISKIQDENKRAKAKEAETKKCSIRARVEHAFRIIKNKFGFKRTRYKGGEKNDSLVNILFASANLLMLSRKGIKLNYR